MRAWATLGVLLAGAWFKGWRAGRRSARTFEAAERTSTTIMANNAEVAHILSGR